MVNKITSDAMKSMNLFWLVKTDFPKPKKNVIVSTDHSGQSVEMVACGLSQHRIRSDNSWAV